MPPGTGWPDDPADGRTPVASSPDDVRRLARAAVTLPELDATVSVCRACPRLVQWREQVAVERRRSFDAEQYWGRPIAGWGDPAGPLLVVGLAPAAHGGNRTGRIFTGDRSGDWLFAALHRAGYANTPVSQRAGDGLVLDDAYVAAAVRCAPPENKPTPEERDACMPFLLRELEAFDRLSVIVTLGGFAYDALWKVLTARGGALPKPRPKFGHGVEVAAERYAILGCYHPSQQNTFTGRLTEHMFDQVFARAVGHADRPLPTL